MATYIPNTPEDIQEMLEAIGVKTVEDLFSELPPEVRLNNPLEIPVGVSEVEAENQFRKLAQKNENLDDNVCFLGGGSYDHIIPAVIDHLLLRGDFFTAYTPYQAEISQGTLQSIYEYQSLICALTGMEYSNASLYDGSTAIVEAINMAVAQQRRNKVIILQSVNPAYRKVVNTLNASHGIELVSVSFEDGITDIAKIENIIDDKTAAVVCQYPNFFGRIEDIEEIGIIAHKAGALSIISANPISLGMLEAPANLQADIVTGEGQPLGISVSFGGPYLGFIATKKKLLRKLPGRIVGMTKDVDGKRGFVLTLQAREQHIRREKSGSNICSNQALTALNATIYMSLMGKQGLHDVANHCFQKAHYMKKELAKINKVSFPFPGSFFHEFVVKIPNARHVIKKMAKKNIFAGILLDNWFSELKDYVLVAVTEKRTKEEIDNYCQLLGGLLND